MAKQAVARVGDVPSGTMVKVEGMDILVANVDGTYYAVEATCPHGQGKLWEGSLEGDILVCPTHGARFHLQDGALRKPMVNYYGLPYGGPATRDLKTYSVQVEDGHVMLTV